MQRLIVKCEESANWLEFSYILKLVRIICIIPLPPMKHCELIDILISRLWSVISLITSGLLGNEHGIPDFPLQQWLRERAAVFLYTHVTCLVIRSTMMPC